LISAIKGQDILTGQYLDPVDRTLYGIASAIPYVPASALVGPASSARRLLENAAYLRTQDYFNMSGLFEGVLSPEAQIEGLAGIARTVIRIID